MLRIIFASIIIFIIFIMACTYLGRLLFWNYADINDHQKFENVIIGKSLQPYKFNTLASPIEIRLPEKYNPGPIYDNFEKFLEESKTVIFIVIKNDTILYQKYFQGYSEESVILPFSITKSFVSAVLGIAIEEGYMTSVNQPITDFLKDFKHEGFEKITLEHLLDMRSGIDFDETYSGIFSATTRFYYGKNLAQQVYNLKMAEEPGLRYNYQSCNTQLLAMAIEKATGRKFYDYFGEKLWSKIGTEHDASWSVDCRKNDIIKSFCCLNARPLDFAKFGKLYLQRGMWNGEQVIPADYITRALSIHNDSRDDAGYPYSYYWRVMDNGSFFAKGIMGQYLHMIPSKNLIFLRIGHSSSGIEWPMLFEEISNQL